MILDNSFDMTTSVALAPKVSVCVVAYNQEKYIGRCLESLILQQTNFPFEIIVGDDCSTDGTRKIIEEYIIRYPTIIRGLFHSKNLGPFENYRVTHGAALGLYVAHLDGDDAALPNKLLEQVNFLDERMDCSGVFHQLKMVGAEGEDLNRCWPEVAPSIFNINYLVLNHPIVGHSSLMYRKGILDGVIGSKYRFIDFRVYVELAKFGSLGFISRPLGLYTSGVGISRANSWLPQVMEAIDYAEEIGVPADIVRKARSLHISRAALNSYYQGDIVKFKELIERSVEYGIYTYHQRFFYVMRSRPSIIRLIDSWRRLLRRVGVVEDVKMQFKR